MKFQSKLLCAVAAIGLGAAALPAAADDFLFDATAVGAFGAPTFGKVSLTQVNTGVLFNVTLDPEFNFITTGNHFVFSFSGTGVAVGDIGPITDAGPQTFSVSTPNAVNPPFGSFQFGIACASNCSNGNSAGGYNDPLSFTVANSTIADFLVPSTNAGNLGPAYFAADVVWRADTQAFGATGSIGATHVTTPVPEPETYALFLAGLGAMGFMTKRRRKTV
jgi:PEP-CTERM motif